MENSPITFTPCPVGRSLGTGFDRFNWRDGLVVGAAQVTGDMELNVLFVGSKEEGRGHFKEFLADMRLHYRTVSIFEVWNERLAGYLTRLGAQPITRSFGQEPSPCPGLILLGTSGNSGRVT